MLVFAFMCCGSLYLAEDFNMRCSNTKLPYFGVESLLQIQIPIKKYHNKIHVSILVTRKSKGSHYSESLFKYISNECNHNKIA